MSQNNMLINEVNNPNFNSNKKEQMITTICEKFSHNLRDIEKIMSYDLELNEEYLIFLLIFLKICVTIKPLIGLPCLYYLSNDINNFRSFKMLVKNKINIIEDNNFKRTYKDRFKILIQKYKITIFTTFINIFFKLLLNQ